MPSVFRGLSLHKYMHMHSVVSIQNFAVTILFRYLQSDSEYNIVLIHSANQTSFNLKVYRHMANLWNSAAKSTLLIGVCTKESTSFSLQCLHHHLSHIFHIQSFQIGKWTLHTDQFQDWLRFPLDAYDEITLARFVLIYLHLGSAPLCR